MDYLQRLRCPAGAPVGFERRGSVARSGLEHLNQPGVALQVSPGTARRLGDFDPLEIPLDAYLLACECGRHAERIFIDMYFRGPERPIAAAGWTLVDGVSPAISEAQTASCPYCGEELRSVQAKQCRHCKMDWHDPDNVHRRS